MLTKYYREEILKVWGNPQKVAEVAYMAFIPHSIHARWEAHPESEHPYMTLEEFYPDHERALNVGVKAGEMGSGSAEAFIQWLQAHMDEKLKGAVSAEDIDPHLLKHEQGADWPFN